MHQHHPTVTVYSNTYVDAPDIPLPYHPLRKSYQPILVMPYFTSGFEVHHGINPRRMRFTGISEKETAW